MEILERVEGWIFPWKSGPACYFCGGRESKGTKLRLYDFEDVLACQECLSLPYYLVESIYWRDYPEKAPPCKHCGNHVPPEQLESAVRRDWFFCGGCADDPRVMLHWERVRRRLWERCSKD